MSKLSIMPYNDMGEAVQRGITSIDSRATRDQIASRLFDCAGKAGLGKIVSFDVSLKGTHISTWDLRNEGKVVIQCDGEGSADFQNSVFRKEDTMTDTTNDAIAADLEAKKKDAEALKAKKLAEAEAKKKEREAAAATKKAEAEAKKAEREAASATKKAEREATKKSKGPTKKDRVHAMMLADGGTTLAMISEALDVGEVAARSLINDVKRGGVTVTTRKDETSKTTYFMAQAQTDAAPAPSGDEQAQTNESPAPSGDAPATSEDPTDGANSEAA